MVALQAIIKSVIITMQCHQRRRNAGRKKPKNLLKGIIPKAIQSKMLIMAYLKLFVKHLAIYFLVVYVLDRFFFNSLNPGYWKALSDPVYILTFLVFFFLDLFRKSRKKLNDRID